MSRAKVESLLRLAQESSSEEEARSAALQAARMMRKHGLTLSSARGFDYLDAAARAIEQDRAIEHAARVDGLIRELTIARVALRELRHPLGTPLRCLVACALGSTIMALSFAASGAIGPRPELARCSGEVMP